MRHHYIALALILTTAASVRAQEPVIQDTTRTSEPAAVPSAEAEVVRSADAPFPGSMELRILGGGIVHGLTSPLRWDENTVGTIARAGMVVVTLSAFDEKGRALMSRNQSRTADRVANAVETMGTVENYAVLGGFLTAGIVLDDSKARAVAMEGLASSAVAAGVITPTLQMLVGRSRPREQVDPRTFDPFSGALSFPSGHTTQAFAVASVIATEYDALWVKAAAYGTAGMVGVARMYHGGHFVSDVATAAFIGTAVGRSIAGHGRELRNMTVEPAVIDGSAGLQVRLRTR
jgi:membrane-associated phospholipid phosphatase